MPARGPQLLFHRVVQKRHPLALPPPCPCSPAQGRKAQPLCRVSEHPGQPVTVPGARAISTLGARRGAHPSACARPCPCMALLHPCPGPSSPCSTCLPRRISRPVNHRAAFPHWLTPWAAANGAGLTRQNDEKGSPHRPIFPIGAFFPLAAPRRVAGQNNAPGSARTHWRRGTGSRWMIGSFFPLAEAPRPRISDWARPPVARQTAAGGASPADESALRRSQSRAPAAAAARARAHPCLPPPATAAMASGSE